MTRSPIIISFTYGNAAGAAGNTPKEQAKSSQGGSSQNIEITAHEMRIG